MSVRIKTVNSLTQNSDCLVYVDCLVLSQGSQDSQLSESGEVTVLSHERRPPASRHLAPAPRISAYNRRRLVTTADGGSS